MFGSDDEPKQKRQELLLQQDEPIPKCERHDGPIASGLQHKQLASDPDYQQTNYLVLIVWFAFALVTFLWFDTDQNTFPPPIELYLCLILRNLMALENVLIWWDRSRYLVRAEPTDE